jgi:hypothetical protein
LQIGQNPGDAFCEDIAHDLAQAVGVEEHVLLVLVFLVAGGDLFVEGDEVGRSCEH